MNYYKSSKKTYETDEEISKNFINYLDKYPLTPYLDSSVSFQKSPLG